MIAPTKSQRDGVRLFKITRHRWTDEVSATSRADHKSLNYDWEKLGPLLSVHDVKQLLRDKVQIQK